MYRIYVGADNKTGERIAPKTVASLLLRCGIDGATICPAWGVWKGTLELSVVIDIDGVEESSVLQLVNELKSVWSQEAVYVVDLQGVGAPR